MITLLHRSFWGLQDVLRMVPVKDDRVLPEELVTNLLATGPM